MFISLIQIFENFLLLLALFTYLSYIFFLFDLGGSLIKFLCKGLPTINTSWPKWQFFFCDERLVPFDNNESTYGSYRRDLLPLLPITEEQFITVNPNLKGKSKYFSFMNYSIT